MDATKSVIVNFNLNFEVNEFTRENNAPLKDRLIAPNSTSSSVMLSPNKIVNLLVNYPKPKFLCRFFRR